MGHWILPRHLHSCLQGTRSLVNLLHRQPPLSAAISTSRKASRLLFQQTLPRCLVSRAMSSNTGGQDKQKSGNGHDRWSKLGWFVPLATTGAVVVGYAISRTDETSTIFCEADKRVGREVGHSADREMALKKAIRESRDLVQRIKVSSCQGPKAIKCYFAICN